MNEAPRAEKSKLTADPDKELAEREERFNAQVKSLFEQAISKDAPEPERMRALRKIDWSLFRSAVQGYNDVEFLADFRDEIHDFIHTTKDVRGEESRMILKETANALERRLKEKRPFAANEANMLYVWYQLREKLDKTGDSEVYAFAYSLAPLVREAALSEEAIEEMWRTDYGERVLWELVYRGNRSTETGVSSIIERQLATNDRTSSWSAYDSLQLRQRMDETGNAGRIIEKVVAEYIGNHFQLDFVKDLKPYWGTEKGKLSWSRSLACMDAIEDAHPGSVRLLHDTFKIKEFGRYPAELLIRQVEEVDTDVPYGLILFPREDWNDAFDHDVEHLRRLFTDTKGHHSLRVFECDTKRDLARALLYLNKKYGAKNKIAFGIWGGHGESDSINLGKDSVDIDDLDSSSAERISTFFEKDAEIALFSCSTGDDSEIDPIGQELSRVFGARVIAPDKPTSLKKLDATYDSNGKIRLHVEYADEGSERAYMGGKGEGG